MAMNMHRGLGKSMEALRLYLGPASLSFWDLHPFSQRSPRSLLVTAHSLLLFTRTVICNRFHAVPARSALRRPWIEMEATMDRLEHWRASAICAGPEAWTDQHMLGTGS
jgi:hypothetical protein